VVSVRSRVAALAMTCLVAFSGIVGVGGAAAASAPAPAATCTPGSGPHLAGKHLDASALATIHSLACADLTGADLSGLDLVQADLTGVRATRATLTGAHLGQADLTGAVLTDATLSGADLTQATLTGADLSGASAPGARFDQAQADHTRFTGADLTNASMIQATLTGAVFDGASVHGADFTQADLGGASFTGIQGLIPWARYLLIAGAVVFLFFGWTAVRKALRRRLAPEMIGTFDQPRPAMAGVGYPSPTGMAGPVTMGGAGAFNPINVRAPRSMARGLALGLLGALLIAFGFHLMVGGLIGQFSFAFDTLATATCTGAACPVGITSGMFGLFGGIFVLIGGFWLLARA
jgi:hypothetical protein